MNSGRVLVRRAALRPQLQRPRVLRMAADLKLHLVQALGARRRACSSSSPTPTSPSGPRRARFLEPAGDLVERAARSDTFPRQGLLQPRHHRAGRALRAPAPGRRSRQRRTSSPRPTGSSSAATSWASCPPAAGRRHGPARARRPARSRPPTAADVALGMRLRAYAFERYRTRRKEGEEAPKRPDGHARRRPTRARSRRRSRARDALADGVILARDLVNEPANVLFPAELRRARARRWPTSASRSRCST